MLKTNYHTHSTFCDGRDSPAKMAQEALLRGFDALGFSSHALYPLSSDWHVGARSYAQYIEEIARLKEEFSGRMEIFCGFEADFVPGLGTIAALRRDFPCDFIIGSVHYICSEKGWFTVDNSAEEASGGIERVFGGDKRAAVCEYFALQREMLRQGGFEIWGHPDLVWKLNPQLGWFSPDDSWYKAELAATAREAARAGVIAEVNTGGMARGRTKEPYPAAQFLELLFRQKVPVTLASDCHRAEHVDFGFDAALSHIKKAGYKEVMFLEGAGNFAAQAVC